MVKAPGSVSEPPPERDTRTEYVPVGTLADAKVAVTCVNVSIESELGAYVVPLAATSTTVVVPSNPAPVRVSVAGALVAEWSGVTPLSLTSAVLASRVKWLGTGTDVPKTRMYQVPGMALGTSTS